MENFKSKSMYQYVNPQRLPGHYFRGARAQGRRGGRQHSRQATQWQQQTVNPQRSRSIDRQQCRFDLRRRWDWLVVAREGWHVLRRAPEGVCSVEFCVSTCLCLGHEVLLVWFDLNRWWFIGCKSDWWRLEKKVSNRCKYDFLEHVQWKVDTLLLVAGMKNPELGWDECGWK